jgi:hypothetical protein
VNSPACPNCGTNVPLQGADDEWCEACGKKLPLGVVAAVHAAAKRLRKAQAAAAEEQAHTAGSEAPVTPAGPMSGKAAKRLPGCSIYLFAAAMFLGACGWLTITWLK